ncbi:hypothetical protein LC593_12830 [Nostoc sp. CHAB 5844]|nr:hypothetical protein [Nostoc sp. CHAB 5844]
MTIALVKKLLSRGAEEKNYPQGVGLQPREQESKGAIAHKGRGFEPYLLSENIVNAASPQLVAHKN